MKHHQPRKNNFLATVCKCSNHTDFPFPAIQTRYKN
ncbi:hypothetical protein LINPERHAP1_LOCUS41249 [Linum perenne]